MAARNILPRLPVTSIFGDEFRRSRSYATQRPHGSRDWLLIYTAGGSGRIGLGASTHLTTAGDLLLYESGAFQDYGTAPDSSGWHLLWAHFIPGPPGIPGCNGR